MKIALTADLHLTNQGSHPDRFQAFSDILRKCGSLGIEYLIIAGDLFDQNIRNYSDFESVYRENAPDQLMTYIIPGNHDFELTDSAIVLENLKVIGETQIEQLDKLDFLFVPYQNEIMMGEAIAPFRNKLIPHNWILIGHGDWSGSVHVPDPYEKGVYMPLSNSDIINYKPLKAFLGHIHLPLESEIVHYIGSPCPMNVNETGLRHFIVFNTDDHSLEKYVVDCPNIYFQESIVILPVDDECEYLGKLIDKQIRDWELPEGWGDRVKIRVSIKGYTTDRTKILKFLQEKFSPFTFYDPRGPLVDQVNQSIDPDKASIAQEVKKWIDNLAWEGNDPEPTKEDILAEALKTIYGD